MKSILAAAAALLLCAAAAASDELQPGRHYDLIEPPAETAVGAGKVEVVELFWYGCPHCYQFEPVIEQWLEGKPEHIEFVRMPAVFAPNWEVHARAYYAAEQLGVLSARTNRCSTLCTASGVRSSPKTNRPFYAELGVPRRTSAPLTIPSTSTRRHAAPPRSPASTASAASLPSSSMASTAPAPSRAGDPTRTC